MREDGLAGLERLSDRPLRRNLAPDVPLGDADDRPTAEERAVRFEDPAVGGVGAGERDHFLDEAAADGFEAEVAGQDLRGLDQGLLAPQALLVLAQEPRRVDGEPELPGDRLGERDLARAPPRRLSSVKAEDPEHAVEDEDGGRERGASSQVDERLPVAELRVRDLFGGLGVVHRHGPPLPGGQVERRKVRSGVADGIDSGRVPLGQDGHRLADLDRAGRSSA